MPSNLTSNMVGNIDTTPVDTYTSPTANVAPDGTKMANVEGYLDGIDLDRPDAGTPVSTPSGNNPFGYEDPNPSALANPGINNPGAFNEFDIDLGGTTQSTIPQGSPGQMNPYDPNQRTSIIEQAQQLGVGNVEQHLTNNNKLKQARDAGLISAEDYNTLGGYDVTQNITGGSTLGGGAINFIGGTLYNTAQAFLDTEGQPTEQIANYNEDGSIDYTTTPTSSQKLKDIPGTVYRNTQGGRGLISQDQKNIHNAIVNGNLDSDQGIAAVKNQIEMSQYRDPIMDMVNQNPLANPNINRGGIDDILGGIDLDNPDNVVDSSMPGMLGDRGGNMDNMTGATTDLVDPNVNIDEFAMPTDPIMDSNLMDIRQQQNLELNQIQDESLKGQLSDIFTGAKNLGKSAIETAQELVDKGIGKYNEINKTITVPGLGEIDVGKTLGGLGLNAAFNAPVSLVMYAMQQIPKSQSQIDYDNFSDEKKAAVDSIYGPGGVMEGYNAVSQFGKGVDETIQGRIDDFQKNYTTEELEVMAARVNKVTGKPEGNYAKLIDAKKRTGGTGINPNDQLDIDNQINLEKEQDEDSDITTGGGNNPFGYTDDPTPPSTPPSDPYGGGPGGVQSGMDAPSAPSAPTQSGPTYSGMGSIGSGGGTPPSDPYGGRPGDNGGGGQDTGPTSTDSSPTSTGGPPSQSSVSTPTGISSAYSSYQNAPTSVGGGGGGGGGSDSCFLPDTLVTMANGSVKKIIDVDIGDEVAVGGKVFATGKFLNDELYDYKGVKVSGSHMVNEDGVWMRIRDTKHGISLGDDENIVYVFGSENRRILINNILFTDYFETKEQDKLLDNEEDFFKNWKSHGKTVSDENVDALNAV